MNQGDYRAQKNQLREHYKKLRNKLHQASLSQHTQASAQVCQQLIARELPSFEQQLKASILSEQPQPYLAVYYAFGSELELSTLYLWAKKLEARYQLTDGILALPAVCGKRSETDNMRFLAVPAKLLVEDPAQLPSFITHPAQITHIEELTQSYPKVSACDISHMILPGLSFSTSRVRLGYGGGYYDRFLHEKRDELNARLLGVCFTEQLSDQLIQEEHDQLMDAVYHAPCNQWQLKTSFCCSSSS